MQRGAMQHPDGVRLAGEERGGAEPGAPRLPELGLRVGSSGLGPTPMRLFSGEDLEPRGKDRERQAVDQEG